MLKSLFNKVAGLEVTTQSKVKVGSYFFLDVVHCAIGYHLYNLKNVKNTHGGRFRKKHIFKTKFTLVERGNVLSDTEIASEVEKVISDDREIAETFNDFL